MDTNDDDPYTRVARGINKRWEAGFRPERTAYASLSKALQTMPEMAEEKMWGIRQSLYTLPVDRNMTVQGASYEIIANPQFFYPKAVIAQGLTYAEAQALIKILES